MQFCRLHFDAFLASFIGQQCQAKVFEGRQDTLAPVFFIRGSPLTPPPGIDATADWLLLVSVSVHNLSISNYILSSNRLTRMVEPLHTADVMRTLRRLLFDVYNDQRCSNKHVYDDSPVTLL